MTSLFAFSPIEGPLHNPLVSVVYDLGLCRVPKLLIQEPGVDFCLTKVPDSQT